MSFNARLETLPNCCGMAEAGNFDSPFNDYNGETPKELVDMLLETSNGRPIIFNFVKRRNYNDVLSTEYEYEELRQYIRAFKGVKHIREWRNPGTNNMIDSYAIFGPLVSKKQRTEEEIEEDDDIDWY